MVPPLVVDVLMVLNSLMVLVLWMSSEVQADPVEDLVACCTVVLVVAPPVVLDKDVDDEDLQE